MPDNTTGGGGRGALTPRTSFLVFMALAAAAEAAPGAVSRLGELRSQERVIRGLMTEVDEQIERVTADRHAKLLAALRVEYTEKLAHVQQQQREAAARPVGVSFTGLLDVRLDPAGDAGTTNLTGVRFDRAVEDGGLELLRFTSRDGRHAWSVDPAAITGIRPTDPADGAD